MNDLLSVQDELDIAQRLFEEWMIPRFNSSFNILIQLTFLSWVHEAFSKLGDGGGFYIMGNKMLVWYLI